MTQVNLLPPEIGQRAALRRKTVLVGAAGAALVGLMVLLYFVQAGHLAAVNNDIAAQETTNASLTSQAAPLQQFAKLKTEADAKRVILTKVYANEVSMASIMQDISDVMPSDAFLESMSVSTSEPGAGTPTASGLTTFVGQVTFAGNAYRQETFPVWLDRIGSITGFENPFLSTYSQSAPGTQLYHFESTANLGTDILTARGKRGAAAVAASGVVVGP